MTNTTNTSVFIFVLFGASLPEYYWTIMGKIFCFTGITWFPQFYRSINEVQIQMGSITVYIGKLMGQS